MRAQALEPFDRRRAEGQRIPFELFQHKQTVPAPSVPGQHALEDAIAFDEPMIERARDMKRDDDADHNAADEVPDEYAVRQRLILADNRRKVEETEDADRIAISVRPRPAENGDDEEKDIERVLR